MLNGYLKQSTASQTRITPPFIDDTDFKTLETALTIANTDVKLSKNGATAVNKNSGGGTHIVNGKYALTFDATDTDTVGELSASIKVAGALVVDMKFWVLEEAIYDALFGAAAAGFDASGRVDLGKWIGVAPLALTSQKVQAHTVTLAAGAVDAAAIATDAIDADAVAADAVAEIAAGIGPKKNTGFNNLEVLMVDSTDHVTPKTGLTLTVTRSIDGAAFGAATGTAAEVGNGIYQFDASAADMNGDVITLRFAATGADDTFVTIKTTP